MSDRPHDARWNQRGLTLVEVMLTVFILALSAMMLAAIYPSAQISRMKAVHYTYATSLAEQKIEELKSAGYASVLVGSPATVAISELPNGSETVAISQYAPNIKKVEVSITWEGYRMVGGSVSLATFIADHS